MITSSIDLGQLIISGLILIVGGLIRFQINQFVRRLDIHESNINDLTASVNRLVGWSVRKDLLDNN